MKKSEEKSEEKTYEGLMIKSYEKGYESLMKMSYENLRKCLWKSLMKKLMTYYEKLGNLLKFFENLIQNYLNMKKLALFF
jgi:hypothetical protein